jgi:hypothetical protein
MKVGRLMIETISHGLYGPAADRDGVQACAAAALARVSAP